MEGSRKYFSKVLLGLVFVASSTALPGQGNCLIYPEDSGERLACELSYRGVTYRQGSAPSQVLFDKAIELGPNYAYAYYEKSVPYFKRGMLVEGVKLINKAIELEPENYLTYRAYWYFSHHSFEACIADLERFYFELNVPLMSTPGGDFEMRMLLALSYAQTGELQKAIDLVEFGVANYEEMGYFISPYDYHVLGMLYYYNDQMEEALDAFDQQLSRNDRLADTYYYIGLSHLSLGDTANASTYLLESLDRFDRKKDGFSFSAFAEYNVSRSQVISTLESI